MCIAQVGPAATGRSPASTPLRDLIPDPEHTPDTSDSTGPSSEEAHHEVWEANDQQMPQQPHRTPRRPQRAERSDFLHAAHCIGFRNQAHPSQPLDMLQQADSKCNGGLMHLTVYPRIHLSLSWRIVTVGVSSILCRQWADASAAEYCWVLLGIACTVCWKTYCSVKVSIQCAEPVWQMQVMSRLLLYRLPEVLHHLHAPGTIIGNANQWLAAGWRRNPQSRGATTSSCLLTLQLHMSRPASWRRSALRGETLDYI